MTDWTVPALNLRRALGAGDTVVGTFVKLPALESIDAVYLAGFDFAVVDMEHAQLDESAASRLVRHARARGLNVVVRLAELDVGLTNRLLEVGAAGIQLSTVRDVGKARAFRDACSYPPVGRRSLSLAHPEARYGATEINAYLRVQATSPPLIVGQIETAELESPTEEIARLLDIVFIGTTDLAVDLGAPGQVDDPTVSSRIDEIAHAARAVGSTLGGFAASPGAAWQLHAVGARYIVVASDIQLLASSLTSAASTLSMLRGG